MNLPAIVASKRLPGRISAAGECGGVRFLEFFRATRITAYLKNGGTLENAAAMANHASTRTTQPVSSRTDPSNCSPSSSRTIWKRR